MYDLLECLRQCFQKNRLQLNKGYNCIQNLVYWLRGRAPKLILFKALRCTEPALQQTQRGRDGFHFSASGWRQSIGEKWEEEEEEVQFLLKPNLSVSQLCLLPRRPTLPLLFVVNRHEAAASCVYESRILQDTKREGRGGDEPQQYCNNRRWGQRRDREPWDIKEQNVEWADTLPTNTNLPPGRRGASVKLWIQCRNRSPVF